jgi:hypothetical protein
MPGFSIAPFVFLLILFIALVAFRLVKGAASNGVVFQLPALWVTLIILGGVLIGLLIPVLIVVLTRFGSPA